MVNTHSTMKHPPPRVPTPRRVDARPTRRRARVDIASASFRGVRTRSRTNKHGQASEEEALPIRSQDQRVLLALPGQVCAPSSGYVMRSSPRRGDRRCDPRWTRSSDPDDDVDVSRRSRIAKRDERNRFDRVDVIASVRSNASIVTVVPMITARRVFSQPSTAASR